MTIKFYIRLYEVVCIDYNALPIYCQFSCLIF